MMLRLLQLLLKKQKRRYNFQSFSPGTEMRPGIRFIFEQLCCREGKTTVISSRENRLIKEYTGLRDKKNKRRVSGLFIIEGARLAFDAVISGALLTAIFETAQARDKYSEYCKTIEGSGAPIYEITSEIASVLSETVTAQGIFCIAKMHQNTLDCSNLNREGSYLALENLQDPGNLGTILRTAEAMGIDGVLLSSGCTEIFSPKVVRASMGAVFRINYAAGIDLIKIIYSLKADGFKTYAAVAQGGDDICSSELNKGSIIVIGNEGNGLTRECADACGKQLTIKMRGRAESLNAAAAATILIWEMTKNKS